MAESNIGFTVICTAPSAPTHVMIQCVAAGTPIAAAAVEAAREAATSGRAASAPTPSVPQSEAQRRSALPSAVQSRTPLPILSPLATPQQPGNLHTPGSGLRTASQQGDERGESAGDKSARNESAQAQGRRAVIQESYKTPGQPAKVSTWLAASGER